MVLASTATFFTFGNVSLRISNHFSLSVVPAVSDKPVTLPPGRAKLATKRDSEEIRSCGHDRNRRCAFDCSARYLIARRQNET